MATFRELMETYGKQMDVRITHGETVWESEHIVSCNLSCDGSLLTSVMKQAEIELESTAFGDNVVGWSGNGIVTRGKNMADPAKLLANGATLQEDGSYYLPSSAALNKVVLWEAPATFTGQITLSAGVRYLTESTVTSKIGVIVGIYYTDGTHEWWPYTAPHTDVRTYTLVSDASKEVDYVTCTYGTASNATWISDFQIEAGGEATAYEPYTTAVCYLENTRLHITLAVTADGESAEKELGTFIVKEAAYNDEYRSVTLTCYDLLLPSMRAYAPFCDFTAPVTLGTYLSLLCQQLGLTLATTEFCNSTVPVEEEKYDSSYTYRDVLTEIAQAAGGTIAVKNEELYVLYPAESGYTIDPSNLKSIELGEKFGPVNSVVLARAPQEDNLYTRADEIEAEAKAEAGSDCVSVTLEGTLAEELRELIITYAPRQSGTGDPSFDNVRPFVLHTVSEVDVFDESGERINNYAEPLSLTDGLCGGVCNWKTGTVTETHRLFTLDGSERWVDLAGETDELLPVGFAGDEMGIARANTALCDRFVRGTADGTAGQFWVSPYTSTVYNIRFMVPKTVAATVAEWKAWLAANPVQAVFAVTEPVVTEVFPPYLPPALAGYTRLDACVYADGIYAMATGEFTLTGEMRIENNQIMDSHREDFLDGLRTALFGLEFYPYDITSFGMGYLDVCDRFTLEALDGSRYSCLFLGSELEITQGITETAKTAAPSATETDYKAADITDKRINQTILRVDKQEGIITGLVSRQETVDGQLKELSTLIEQTADRVEIAVNATVNEVTTSTGFTFNADGMRVARSDSEMATTVDEDGMNVSRNGEDVLVADSNGVDAVNITVHQYLVVGGNSRFEDYTDDSGEGRTGCFYIG